HIARMPASGDDEALVSANVHILILEFDSDTKNSACRRFFSDDAGQLVPKKNFDAFSSGALFQSSHDTRASSAIDRFFQIVRIDLGRKEPWNSSAFDTLIRTLKNSGFAFTEFHTVLEQELKCRGVLIRPHADQLPIAA